MARQRKIRHYNIGYLSKKKRSQTIGKTILFLLGVGVLIFVGYTIAQTINKLNNESSIASLPDFSQQSSQSQSASSAPIVTSSEPEPEPEPEMPQEYRAILLPLTEMTSLETVENFLKTVDKTLYNTVVLPLKDKTGTLYFQTTVPLALTVKAVSPEAMDLQQLAELIQKYELIPGAQLYALQDDFASHALYNTSYLYENQSITWLDNSVDAGGKSWLNPYMEATESYLNSLTGEVSAAGFEAIFVYGCQYPNTGNQRGMGYGDQKGISTGDALQNILKGMEAAAQEYDAKIIPAFQGDCYKEGVRTQIYTVNPNTFTFSLTSPILDKNLTLLDQVTGEPSTLVPAISAELLTQLSEKGITQYLVQ